MGLDHHEEPSQTQNHLSTAWRRQTRRRVPLLRRRKVQTVRLGGKRRGRRMLVVLRMLKKIRLKWLKLQYRCMLRKLKEYYRNLVKDMVEAGATLETFQHRLFLETSFAIPTGVTFSSYPHGFGSDRPRTIFLL